MQELLSLFFFLFCLLTMQGTTATAVLLKWQNSSQDATEIATTCSQANDSSVCPPETLLLHFEAHPVPKPVLYFSTQLLLLLLFFTSFSLQNTAPGLRLLEMKKISFLFPYIQLCFCNKTKGSTGLQYTAQLSTPALQYWPCSRKICECLLMLLTSEAHLLRWLHLFKRPLTDPWQQHQPTTQSTECCHQKRVFKMILLIMNLPENRT